MSGEGKMSSGVGEKKKRKEAAGEDGGYFRGRRRFEPQFTARRVQSSLGL